MSDKHSVSMDILSSHSDLLLISLFGAIVLFGLKVSEHFMRSEQDKLPWGRYIGFLIFLILALPISGVGVTCVYILNGDKLSALLAFQIGLTSPAVLQKIASAAANNMAKNEKPVVAPQQ